MKTFNLFTFVALTLLPFTSSFSQTANEEEIILDSEMYHPFGVVFTDVSDQRINANTFHNGITTDSRNYPELGYTIQRIHTVCGSFVNIYIWDHKINPNDLAYASDPYLHNKSNGLNHNGSVPQSVPHKMGKEELTGIMEDRVQELVIKAEVDAYNNGFAWRKGRYSKPDNSTERQFNSNSNHSGQTYSSPNRTSNGRSNPANHSNVKTEGGGGHSPMMQHTRVSHTLSK